MNVPSIVLWGFVATLLLSAITTASQGLGMSRMSIPFMLGTVFTPDRNRAGVYGFLAHFAIGWCIAFGYALIFESWGRANWLLGGVLGLVHGLLFLLVVMPLLPGLHPRMASAQHGPEPTRNLEPPGFLALNYGRRTPIIALLAHMVYGIVIGAFYHLAVH